MEDNHPVPAGEFAGRYTIERELGRGGAAIVYLARDSRQERQVALKVLHRELAQAIGAQRFLREIKHSSALQHPHLLSIHDSGESDGLLYFVMPYMADGSLRRRIAKEKQLSIEEALRVTRHVGEALAYAHSRGIVHRDIKPDNVLFSGDHACLADFGIARAVDSVAADTLTSTGLVVGTPAYMSPEQASGEREVDARSDQYSLACLLYEMITGLPPFIGATMQSVISQRFTQPPPSMRAHRPNVPDHVERAVKRGLAIVPADRFASVADFVAALDDASAVPEPVSAHSIRRRWFAVGAAAAIALIAVMAAGPGSDWVRGAWETPVDTARFVVLPFLSDEDPALGPRIATALHAALRTWDGLGLEDEVAVRDVVQRNGGQVSSLRDAFQLARKMGAGRLIWGTASSQSGAITVVAHLYDVASSSGLAEHAYASTTQALSDSALRALANALIAPGTVPPGVDDGLSGTRSYAALQAYRRGIGAMRRFDLPLARTELRSALALDSDFAIAHLELARVEGWMQPRQSSAWIANARRAVALREELRPQDAKRAEALLAYAQQDYAVACQRYRDLITTDTLDARAWYGLGECLHADGIVVPDPRSRSAFSFRSSWHAAGAAFLRALEIEPALHGAPHFMRLSSLFPTVRNRVRTGITHGSDSIAFGAVPSLAGDTLAFTPYRMPNFEREDDEEGRARRARALVRNRQVLFDLTTSWVRAYPRNPEAHTALASILEGRGDLAGATRSLVTAASLATEDLQKLLLFEGRARVGYKAGDFAAARRVADSALALFSETTEDNWEPVARLAGLVGHASRLGDALQFFWPKYAEVFDLDQGINQAGGRGLARAVMGLCDSPPGSFTRDFSQLVRARVPPERHAEVNERMLGLILSFSAPCGPATSSVGRKEYVTRAQGAFALGQPTVARAILDSAARNRSHLRPGDVSPTIIAREAFLRLAMSDTGRALGLIDGTLSGLPTIAATTMLHPLESATLVRMMAAKAELAAAMGDRGSAGEWALAVASLWSGSDPLARPTVKRMRELAAVQARE